MVPRARHDGAKADTTQPEEAGEAEAPIVPADAPEVGQMGGGAIEASPTEAAMARTSKPELPASSVIGGSTPEGEPMTEGVPSALVGPTPTVTTANPSVGAGSSGPLSGWAMIRSCGEEAGSNGLGGWT